MNFDVRMLRSIYKDLLKAPWLKIVEALKREGGMSISILGRHIGASYMATKDHCEALTQLGYLVRTRVPRVEVGRPEIDYSLSAKAEELFPGPGEKFTLGILEHLKRLYGENAPDKIWFQWYEEQAADMKLHLAKAESLEQKGLIMVRLRQEAGCSCELKKEAEQVYRLIECHNPMRRLFEAYPRAQAMEHRMIEQALGMRVTRREEAMGRDTPPRVIFEFE